MEEDNTTSLVPQGEYDRERDLGLIMGRLLDLVSSIPVSGEIPRDSPLFRAEQIIRESCRRAALCSAGCAVLPGPLGYVSIIPDLLKVWKIQRQMVSDIASLYGKSAVLTREMMLYCLFRHGAGIAGRDLVVRAGSRLLVKQLSSRALQNTLQKVGLTVTRRAVGAACSRWAPLAGSALMGGYSYWDTKRVGKTVLETFAREIALGAAPGESPAARTGE